MTKKTVTLISLFENAIQDALEATVDAYNFSCALES